MPRDIVRRVERENFPLVALHAVQELRDVIAQIEADAIVRAMDMGATTGDIARAMGITRQAAYARVKQLRTRRAQAEGEPIVVPEVEETETTP